MSKNDKRRLPDITFIDTLVLVQVFLSDADKYDSNLIQIKDIG